MILVWCNIPAINPVHTLTSPDVILIAFKLLKQMTILHLRYLNCECLILLFKLHFSACVPVFFFHLYRLFHFSLLTGGAILLCRLAGSTIRRRLLRASSLARTSATRQSVRRNTNRQNPVHYDAYDA